MTPTPQPCIRKAAVAGSFYPDDAALLRRELSALLATQHRYPRPKALILPHAGYCYCAATAARALHHLHGHSYQQVVVICPTHRVATRGAALPAASHFATPLGTIPLDQSALTILATDPNMLISDRVHQQEHAIEVLLPYLQLVLPPFNLIPIAAGAISPDQLACAMQPLWQQQQILFIISSDLSHFHPYDQANAMDSASCNAIVSGDDISHDRACGATGINTLQRLRRNDDRALQRLHYCNSGDTLGGRESVVGYASFVL